MKSGLCKESKNRYRRELVEGSLEVFPLKNSKILYGAIQNGTHRFYANDNGVKGKFESIARFSHVWMLKNDAWQLSRIFSCDHKGKGYLGDANKKFKDENAIRDFIKENNIPALGVGVIEKGQIEQIRLYGEIKPGVKAPYNAIFNVASLTKPVTSLVTLKLVRMGDWDLDKPLRSTLSNSSSELTSAVCYPGLPEGFGILS